MTFASRMVKVFGTQRPSQFLLAVFPTFAQNPAGTRATAARTAARIRRGPRTIRQKQHAAAMTVETARPANSRNSGT
jgi:hypothetical protein